MVRQAHHERYVLIVGRTRLVGGIRDAEHANADVVAACSPGSAVGAGLGSVEGGVALGSALGVALGSGDAGLAPGSALPGATALGTVRDGIVDSI